MDVACYSAPGAGKALEKSTISRRDLRPNDCLIKIRWAGICHSDIHTVNGDWPHDNFPMTPGHEIIGEVTEVGAEVQNFRPGDVVGIGCLVDSCLDCDACREGDENYCENGSTGTYNAPDRIDGTITQGGYSTHIVCREEFLIRIPEAFADLESDAAAAATPLLCAGITTYSPLKHWDVGEGSRVAVVGMGGGKAGRGDGRGRDGLEPLEVQGGRRPGFRRQPLRRHQGGGLAQALQGELRPDH